MTIATYAGIALEGQSSITWAMTTGVTPYVTSITVSNGTAAAIAKVMEDFFYSEININGDEFKEVYLVRIEPASHQNSRIVLADKRWLWGRDELPNRGFNVRRRIGDKYMLGEQPENAVLVDKYFYEDYSLNSDGSIWTYSEILEDVIGPDELFASKTELDKVPVDSFWLGGTVADCYSRVLSLHGGLSLWVNQVGDTVVASRKETEARGIVETPGQEAIGGGSLGFADRRWERPRSVTVYFELEQELRFDYEEPKVKKTETDDPRDPPLDLDNVIPTTDIEYGRGRGNWMEITRALEEVPTFDQYRAPFLANMKLDLPTLRKYLLKPFALGKLFSGNGTSFSGIDATSAFWQRVIRISQQHFRKTFRINQFWRDKVREMRSYRVSEMDADTGTRGTSQAFMDYTQAYSGRFLYMKTNTSTGCPQAVVKGWAKNLDDASAAPAEVSIVDQESGVLRVYLLADTSGDKMFLIPGAIDKPFTIRPNMDGLGTFVSTLAQCGVTDEFKMSVVLTCTLNPTHKGQRRAYFLDDAEDHTSAAAWGPPISIRIPATPHTIGRMAWSDERAEEIRRAVIDGDDVRIFSITGIGEDVLLLNAKELSRIGQAVAKSVYEMFDSTGAGTATYAHTPGNMAEPFGGRSACAITVNTDGTVLQNIRCTMQSAPRQWQTRLSTYADRALAGLVLRNGGG